MKTVIVVPTLNAGPLWPDWIVSLLATDVDVSNVYVIDSGSTDKTVSLAGKAGFNIESIKKESFNHGGTRQNAIASLADVDFVIYLTQDAVLASADALQKILSPFKDEQVAAVCGRQLPRQSAALIGAHARLYNYAPESSNRSIIDVDKYGLKTAFISNSFAAYRISALLEVGGFPSDVIFGEDMFVATKMLKAGYRIAYAADACVYHSHDYSLWQEMKRYFDMGVFHAREPWIRQELGGAEGEGLKFVVSEMRYLLKNAFWRIPEGMLRTFLRYTGFRLGLMEKRLPPWLKSALAMNKGYFKR